MLVAFPRNAGRDGIEGASEYNGTRPIGSTDCASILPALRKHHA